ncbi:MAG: DPP IV N-terminal domain-containing protein, partial [Planctomycetota bacterium]
MKSFPVLLLRAGAALFALPVVLLGFASTIAAGERRLTLEQVSGRGAVRFSAQLDEIRWAVDGAYLRRGRGDDEVWIDPESGEEKAPEHGQPQRDLRRELREAFARLPGFGKEDAQRASRVRSRSSAEGGAVLIPFESDLYFYRKDQPIRRLTNDDELEQNAVLSPDGRWASFVKANDLYLLCTEDGSLRRATRDGSGEILNGRLDWVYQEEVYGRANWKGYWWSPDSRAVAFLQLNQAGVPHFTIVDHIPYRAEVSTTRYPKAGDPNPKVRLGVVHARGGKRWVDLSDYTEEILIVNVSWSPEGDQLLFQVQNRTQTWLDLNAADPDTGKVTRLVRETSPTWVNTFGEPRWLADGTFLWFSERSGY